MPNARTARSSGGETTASMPGSSRSAISTTLTVNVQVFVFSDVS